MKWMGWSWADYLEAPVSLVNEIVEILNERD